MTILYSDTIKQAFEAAVNRSNFSMPQLYEQITALADEPLLQRIQLLIQVLGKRPAHHVLQSLLRFSFLIETVLTRGGATKITVRWANALTNDLRYAEFEECNHIFEALFNQLQRVLHDEIYMRSAATVGALRVL